MTEQKRNRIKCLKCGDVIESTFRHDFRTCSCEACFVDGGHDYQRFGGNFDDIMIVKDDDTLVPIRYRGQEDYEPETSKD